MIDYVERLKKLRAVVKAVPPKQFDMRYWKTVHSCGTTACAAGHAAQDPWFTRRGLHLDKDCKIGDSIVSFTIRYRSFEGFGALAEFFDLPYGTIVNVFNNLSYERGLPNATVKKQCLARIDDLIEIKKRDPFEQSAAHYGR